MARKCVFTGKRPNVANQVSHSNIKTKKRQLPNVQSKRLFWEEAGVWVRLRLSTSAMRTISKQGLGSYARAQGVDLSNFLDI